jgi:hypothetical protein
VLDEHGFSHHGTRAAAVAAVTDYIDVFYNRRH